MPEPRPLESSSEAKLKKIQGIPMALSAFCLDKRSSWKEGLTIVGLESIEKSPLSARKFFERPTTRRTAYVARQRAIKQ